MFNEYEKDGRIIHATNFAYEVLYKAQGYKPRGEENVLFAFEIENAAAPAENLNPAGSGKTNSRADTKPVAGKPKKKSK